MWSLAHGVPNYYSNEYHGAMAANPPSAKSMTVAAEAAFLGVPNQ
jgi:hypothetical protein